MGHVCVRMMEKMGSFYDIPCCPILIPEKAAAAEEESIWQREKNDEYKTTTEKREGPLTSTQIFHLLASKPHKKESTLIIIIPLAGWLAHFTSLSLFYRQQLLKIGGRNSKFVIIYKEKRSFLRHGEYLWQKILQKFILTKVSRGGHTLILSRKGLGKFGL